MCVFSKLSTESRVNYLLTLRLVLYASAVSLIQLGKKKMKEGKKANHRTRDQGEAFNQCL